MVHNSIYTAENHPTQINIKLLYTELVCTLCYSRLHMPVTVYSHKWSHPVSIYIYLECFCLYIRHIALYNHVYKSEQSSKPV